MILRAYPTESALLSGTPRNGSNSPLKMSQKTRKRGGFLGSSTGRKRLTGMTFLPSSAGSERSTSVMRRSVVPVMPLPRGFSAVPMMMTRAVSRAASWRNVGACRSCAPHRLHEWAGSGTTSSSPPSDSVSIVQRNITFSPGLVEPLAATLGMSLLHPKRSGQRTHGYAEMLKPLLRIAIRGLVRDQTERTDLFLIRREVQI